MSTSSSSTSSQSIYVPPVPSYWSIKAAYLLLAFINVLAEFRAVPVVVQMLTSATATIFIGSMYALFSSREFRKQLSEYEQLKASGGVSSSCAACMTPPKPLMGETMQTRDAMMFPIMGSIMLGSLYLVYKFLPGNYVNVVVKIYFFLVGFYVLAVKIGGLIEISVSENTLQRLTASRFTVPNPFFYIEKAIAAVWPFGKTAAPQSETNSADQKRAEDSKLIHTCDAKKGQKLGQQENDNEDTSIIVFHYLDFIAFILSLVATIWYVSTGHFAASNMFGIVFSVQAIELLSLGSYFNGVILLSGLFFYDVFWVFGTEVMVTVAKSFDAPIKLLFPQMSADGRPSMLGLGDIVIPGIFIALLLRFDEHIQYEKFHKKYDGAQKSKSVSESASGFRRIFSAYGEAPYFYMNLLWYFLGLALTFVVMFWFNHAQPALLYLVPACLGASLLQSVIRGEFPLLWRYSEQQPQPADEQQKQTTATAEEKQPNAN